jgi:hypothetical protein
VRGNRAKGGLHSDRMTGQGNNTNREISMTLYQIRNKLIIRKLCLLLGLFGYLLYVGVSPAKLDREKGMEIILQVRF